MSIPVTQYGFVYNKSTGLNLNKNLPVQSPGVGQVLLKVDAVGLCHSDLHVIYEGLDCGDNYVMGHEIAGTVADVGPEVENCSVGDRVAALGPNGCGDCRICRSGAENDCKRSFANWFGLGVDGGYQQYLLVSKPRNLVRIPDNVSSEVAAAATDAVLTPYHALKMTKIGPSSNILIIGAGGLGINAVQIAKAFGAHVTVLDKKEKARALVKKYGADVVLESLPASTETGIFNACFDFVSVQSTFEICQKYCEPRGCIVPVGLGSPKITLDLADLDLREIRICGSFWGTANDLEEVFALIGKGMIKPMVQSAKLEELPQYIEKLRKNEYEGRVRDSVVTSYKATKSYEVSLDSVGGSYEVSLDSVGGSYEVSLDSVGGSYEVSLDSVGGSYEVSLDSVGGSYEVSLDSVGGSYKVLLHYLASLDSVDSVDSVDARIGILARSLIPPELGDEYVQSIANELFISLWKKSPTKKNQDISQIINKFKVRFLSNNLKSEWLQFQEIVNSLAKLKDLNQIANYLVFFDALHNGELLPMSKSVSNSKPKSTSFLEKHHVGRNGKTLAQLIEPYYETLSEKEILTYLPYTLRGMDSKLVEFTDNYRQLEIPQTINESYSSLLRSIFEYAFLYKQLILVVENDRGTNPSTVQAAFVALLEEITKEYIGELNQVFTEGPTSILSVYQKIFSWIYKLRFLYRISLKLKTLDGYHLLTHVHKFTKFGDKNISDIAKRVFAEIVKPYYKIIEFWIIKGELVDENNEFFITFDRNENSFDKIINFHKEKVPDFVHSSDKIFQIGKTLIFLNKYCRELEWINRFNVKYSKRLFSNDSRNSNYSNMATSTTNSNNNNNGLATMSENEVVELIADEYDETLSYFTKLMHQKYNLLTHLQIFKKFYLIGASDFIESIMIKGKTVLDKPSLDITPSQLDKILNEAIQSSAVKTLKYTDRVDMKVFTSEIGSFGWESFLLNYKIDDLPFSYLLEDQISEYFKMFHLLRKLRHLEILLNANYEMYSVLNNKFSRSIRKQFSRRFKSVTIANVLRNHIIKFLQNLISFLSYDIIEESYESVIVKRFFYNDNDTDLLLDKSFMKLDNRHYEHYNVNKLTIDDLIRTHGRYLEQIVYTDLLNEKKIGKKTNISYVYQIYDLLQTIFDFVTADQEYHSLILEFAFLVEQSYSGDFETGQNLEKLIDRMNKVMHKLKIDIFESEFKFQLNNLKEDLKLDNNLQEFGTYI
ncbi:SPC98 [Candida oxycetoniae]|uniref:SPC98 n=1 Tax=Candida oxycetoniae TaxID=497107 RepID=A0AAI9T160_9ASCO|nr:SPC98 [Candida oxycetoniae]KAI3406434.2 SPC98 [Candida oxycetoniae]